MGRHGLSLIEVERAFGTEEKCLAYAAAARWPNGVECLKCGSDKVSPFKTNETTRERKNKKGEIREVRVPARHLFQCNAEGCRYQFSAIAGTIFTDTHLPLSTWFKAIALLANAKKGISALQMQRDLGVNYRTAWHLNHRIREAMQSEGGLFGGTVEVDATFVGGKFDKRRARAKYDKYAVAGVLKRGTEGEPSQVKTFPVPIESKAAMHGIIKEHVAVEAHIMSDEHATYKGLGSAGYSHEIVRHGVNEWVRGNVHTNGIESFWSLFKRGVIGSFHQVSGKHLHRYLNEFSFRFNSRESSDLFGMIVINLLIGSALRYKELTAPIGDSESPEAPQTER